MVETGGRLLLVGAVALDNGMVHDATRGVWSWSGSPFRLRGVVTSSTSSSFSSSSGGQ